MSTLYSWLSTERTISRDRANGRIVKLLIVGGLGFALAAGGAPLPPLSGELQIHDPSTILKCGDSYWVFGTGTGILSRFSKDMVNWTEGPRVFAQAPTWTTEVNPRSFGKFWAPDLVYSQGQYLLYYSVSSWGSRESAIGLARNPTLNPKAGDYGWQDAGLVVRTANCDDHNAIDPSVLLDRDDRLWLAFGSYWSGIKLVELSPKTGLRLATNSPIYSLAWNGSIEAACLHQRPDNYYLFVNWGQCCRGTNSTYEIRMGRSASVTGTYLDRDGKDLLQGGGSLLLSTSGHRIGPGHAGVITVEGQYFLSYHFYNARERGRAMLEIAPLKWSADGWPEVVTPIHAGEE
jgi:arabinan endo-1,5-alpha-L-arabinosidase